MPLKLLKNVPEPESDLYLCFLDPSSEENIPGWPLRNLLLLVKYNR